MHPGQYLNEGTQLTTLQGIDGAVHVDFAVSQQVAVGLRVPVIAKETGAGISRSQAMLLRDVGVAALLKLAETIPAEADAVYIPANYRVEPLTRHLVAKLLVPPI